MVYGFDSDSEIEKCILGAFITDPSMLTFLTQINGSDFADQSTHLIFQAIQGLYLRKDPIDLMTVDAEITQANGENIAKILLPLLVELTRFLPSTANTAQHVKILKERSARRNVISAADRLRNMAENPEITIAEAIATAENAFNLVRTNATDGWMSLKDVLIQTYAQIENRAQGLNKPIQSGISSLDNCFYGFLPGEVTILAARPGGGKSALGGFLALAAAKSGIRVGVVSLEMAAEQYGQRLLATDSGVNLSQIRNAQVSETDWVSLARSSGDMSNLPIDFLFGVNDIGKLRAAVDQKVSKGMGMLVVDYLQLLRTSGKEKTEYETISKISITLKELALRHNIPVLALAQLNRETEKRNSNSLRKNEDGAGAAEFSEPSPPRLSDLRGSGSIEQDADNVIMLYHPKSAKNPYVNLKDISAFENWKSKGLVYTVLLVLKQRQGETGHVCMLFDPKSMRYPTIDRNTQHDIPF